MLELYGYKRKNGTVGIRNNVICIATVVCASAAVEGICRNVPEIIPVIHTDGCETRRVKTLYFTKTLEQICLHPNNYAVMLIGLGCERDNAVELAAKLESAGVRVWVKTIQKDGGCQPIIEEGTKQAKAFLREAALVAKVPITIADLTIGIETPVHIDNEHRNVPCLGNERNQKDANTMAETIGLWINKHGGNVIVPSSYKTQSKFAEIYPVKEIHFADDINEENTFYVINQDHPDWKGKENGVFNMTPEESLLSMAASGAQLLLFSSGTASTIGLPIVPVIKYAVDNGFDKYLEDTDITGSYSRTLAAEMETIIEKTINGQTTKSESHRCGDIICTYRRTNIY